MTAPRLLLIGAVISRIASGQTIRDSAGIQIIENARPSSRIRVAARPDAIIGNRDGDAYLLSGVRGAARLANGNIVVANAASYQLRFYDSTGNHVRSIGQRGGGPGDFDGLDVFYKLPGDTLMAGSMTKRHSYFTAAGAFIRDGALLMSLPGLPPGPKAIVAVLSNQTVVAAVPNFRPQSNGRVRWVDSGPLLTVDRASRVRKLGDFPFMTLQAGAGGDPSPPWFSATTAFAAGPDLYSGFGSEYSIKVFKPDGKLVRIIRRAWTPRPVTKSDIDRYVEEWSANWIKPNSPTAAKEREELRSMGFAASLPAFSEFRVDDAGRLWVREPNLADAPSCGCLNEGPGVSQHGASSMQMDVGSAMCRCHPGFTPRTSPERTSRVLVGTTTMCRRLPSIA